MLFRFDTGDGGSDTAVTVGHQPALTVLGSVKNLEKSCFYNGFGAF